jgi:hypothetical protein
MLVSIAEGTSLFGGLVIFTVIGYMAKMADKPIQKVVQAGACVEFNSIYTFQIHTNRISK